MLKTKKYFLLSVLVLVSSFSAISLLSSKAFGDPGIGSVEPTGYRYTKKPKRSKERVSFYVLNGTSKPVTYKLISSKLGTKVGYLLPGSRRTYYPDLLGDSYTVQVEAASNPAFTTRGFSSTGRDGKYHLEFKEYSPGTLSFRLIPNK